MSVDFQWATCYTIEGGGTPKNLKSYSHCSDITVAKRSVVKYKMASRTVETMAN